MPAAFGALSDDDVRPRFSSARGFMDCRDHVHDDGASVVRAREQRRQVVLGGWPGGREDGRPGGQDSVDRSLVSQEEQQIEPEGFPADACADRRC